MEFLPLKVNSTLDQEIGNELVVYDWSRAVAYCLDETTARVYKACNGLTRLEDFTAQSTLSEEAVYLVLQELEKVNLLQESPGLVLPPRIATLSRRELIKKAGLAASIPAISSLLIPFPAAAASLRPNLASCSSNGDCQSNNCTAAATGGRLCCAPGVGSAGSAVPPGSATCTPVGTCLTTYSTSRCCNQGGTSLVAAPNVCTNNGLEFCRCN